MLSIQFNTKKRQDGLYVHTLSTLLIGFTANRCLFSCILAVFGGFVPNGREVRSSGEGASCVLHTDFVA